jgi:hypothetical protein
MLVHIFNAALKARNGSAIVALRWTPLFSLPLSDGRLTYSVVDSWCIERPAGGLVGEYVSCLSALASAWRLKP